MFLSRGQAPKEACGVEFGQAEKKDGGLKNIDASQGRNDAIAELTTTTVEQAPRPRSNVTRELLSAEGGLCGAICPYSPLSRLWRRFS